MDLTLTNKNKNKKQKKRPWPTSISRGGGPKEPNENNVKNEKARDAHQIGGFVHGLHQFLEGAAPKKRPQIVIN